MPHFQISKIMYSLDRVSSRPAMSAKELAGDQGYVPVNADNPCSIGVCPDRIRNVSSVVIKTVSGSAVVNRIVIAVEGPTVNIVNIPITIVVSPVDRIEGVCPNLAAEVRIGILDTFVNYSNVDRCGTPVSGRLGFSGLTRGLVSRRSGIAIHSPEETISVIGIASNRLMLVNPIWFYE